MSGWTDADVTFAELFPLRFWRRSTLERRCNWRSWLWAINSVPHRSTGDEAIGDWDYWAAQGYRL